MLMPKQSPGYMSSLEGLAAAMIILQVPTLQAPWPRIQDTLTLILLMSKAGADKRDLPLGFGQYEHPTSISTLLTWISLLVGDN